VRARRGRSSESNGSSKLPLPSSPHNLLVLIVVCVLLVALMALRIFGPSRQERILQLLRFDRLLGVRWARSPKRLWIEIIAMAVAGALLIVLFDWWLASRLSPATLAVLIWGTWT
jgi:hypothetical protein